MPASSLWSNLALRLCAIGIILGATSSATVAQTERQRLKLLERTVQELLKRDEAREKELQRLRSQVRRLRGGWRGGSRSTRKGQDASKAARKHAGHNHGSHSHGNAKGSAGKSAGGGHDHGYGKLDTVWSADVGGGATLVLRRIGVDVVFGAGGSSVNNEHAEGLFGGGHDARVKGFTVQTVDLSVRGSLEPYFDAYLGLAFFIDSEGESRFELEEAYLQTKKIWGFLRIKAGQFFTQFGRFNPLHVHDWQFIHQPVIMTRMFGEDNLRGQGVEFEATLPLPWKSRILISMQNAQGETMSSFLASDEVYEERPIGGRAFNANEVDGFDEFVYVISFKNAIQVSKGQTLFAGVSGAFGPNPTGNNARTTIIGFDIGGRHDVGESGKIVWAAEFLYRWFQAKADAANGLSSDNLHDYGFYAQAIWFPNPHWGIGFRGEYASGSGRSVGGFASRGADPFRGDRVRLAPMVVWKFSPLASLKAQYIYDFATFLPATANRRSHAFFMNVVFGFGLGGGHAHEGHDH